MAPAITPATADRIAVSLFMMISLIVMIVGKRSRPEGVRQLPRFKKVILNGAVNSLYNFQMPGIVSKDDLINETIVLVTTNATLTM